MTPLLTLLSPLARIGFAAGTGGLVTLAMVPLVEWGARRLGWMDRPSPERWHDGAIPHVGGVAIGIGIAAGVLVDGEPTALPVQVWSGAALLFAAGLVDDLWGLRPASKLGAQLGATGLVLSAGLFFWPAGPTWVSGLLTVLWVLGLTNAFNLLDAMDGIAAGVTAIAALSFSVLAFLQGRFLLAVISTVIAAAAAGFLVYNFSPARLFMGDCGSLLLGYLLAALGLSTQQVPAADLSVLISVAVLAVPLFDTLFVTITRTLRGQSIAEGGIDHTMHRLTRLGWSERQVALLFYGVATLCGGSGLLGWLGPPSLFYGLAIGLVGGALSIAWLLMRYTEPEASTMPDGDSHRKEPPFRETSTDGEIPLSENPWS